MVWKLPTSNETFDVDIRGKVYSLPLLGEISLDQMDAIEGMNLDEDTITLASIRDLFNTIAPELPVGSLGAQQLRALMTAWQKESGVGVGESSASTASSKTTAKK